MVLTPSAPSVVIHNYWAFYSCSSFLWQTSTSSYGWFVSVAVQTLVVTSKNTTTIPLRESSVSIKKALLHCWTVWCTKCVSTDSVLSTQSKVCFICGNFSWHDHSRSLQRVISTCEWCAWSEYFSVATPFFLVLRERNVSKKSLKNSPFYFCILVQYLFCFISR